ncbi:MAG: Lrp/AsnC family transcriptional regulator [Myxococcota bacterium]
MPSAADYIEALQTDGRLTFTTEQAVEALGRSVPAVRAQLRRLKDKGHIADPYRGFHVIVPARYRRLGCLPPDRLSRN